jgi:cyclopropane-fatty-acyl-phospholipid synthase
MLGFQLAEKGLLPDSVIRMGIRKLVRDRAKSLENPNHAEAERARAELREELRHGPIAIATRDANAQHYEVSPDFYRFVLGHRMKYSSGIWGDGIVTLDDSEDAMLHLTAERAEIENGMRILDLGCGWGSFSLWVAEHYPDCRVLAVSNSKSQREFILQRCLEQGFENVEVVTADVNHFAPDRTFDRVVSVEMFEHVRNHELLLSRIASWLVPGGKLFVHHFAHRHTTYRFEAESDDDWMAREFFTGGLMPSDDLLSHLQRDLKVERSWRVVGSHYQKTSEAWLRRQDEARDVLLPILADVYGSQDAKLWFQRWRMFFLACAELFGSRNGNEWWVTHVRMVNPGAKS